MKKIISLIFASIGFFACALHSFGQRKQNYQPPSFVDADRLQKIEATKSLVEKIYKEFAEKNHFPGYAFAIVADGKLIYSGSGGYANISQKIPATEQSMFRIASMSKSFTAMAILKLRDEGKLKLDDPLYIYIPEIKNQQLTADAPPITIRNLLSHSAGYPEDNPWGDRQLAKSEEDLINLYKKGVSFSNDPGLYYEYSNLGFATLGYIIHKVSGTPYEKYIAENIWQPLGIKASWEYSTVAENDLAHGYRWLNETWKEETPLHDGIYGAMGGMITSVESFSKYVAYHLSAWPPRNDIDDGPLKRSSVREMHQPWRFNSVIPDYKFPNGKACPIAIGYGYGLGITKDCEGRMMVAHSGGLPGFGSNWRILPDYSIGVILFANVTYASTGSINLQVLDTIVRMAKLQPRRLPPSLILTQRRDEIVSLLPDFSAAKTSGIFAENFFLDYFTDSLKKEANLIFDTAGKIIKVADVVPENQLRGYFLIECDKGKVQINFTLTPETPSLIQEYHIRLLKD
jgi:CubicO group peptidase (beta-lactamase class C family)